MAVQDRTPLEVRQPGRVVDTELPGYLAHGRSGHVNRDQHVDLIDGLKRLNLLNRANQQPSMVPNLRLGMASFMTVGAPCQPSDERLR